MAVDWSRPLTRVLTLKSGERLRTLHDAAELFSTSERQRGGWNTLQKPSEGRTRELDAAV